MGNLIAPWGIFSLQSRLLFFSLMGNTCILQYHSSSWSKNSLQWSLEGVRRPRMNGQHGQDSTWGIKELRVYSLHCWLPVFELLVISAYFDCKFFKAGRITLYLYRAEHIGSGLIFRPVGLPITQIITMECYQTLGIFLFYLKVGGPDPGLEWEFLAQSQFVRSFN